MFKKQYGQSKRLRINRQIFATQVRVIDENSKQIGVIPIDQALNLARDKGLDLIEVSPNAAPPVCKILDFDKYRYQQIKQEQRQRKKQKKIEIKGIRLTPRIGVHDLEFKAKQAKKFLEAGNKVEVQLFMKGREWLHRDLSAVLLEKFIEKIGLRVIKEMEPTRQGSNILMVLVMDKNQ